MDNTQLYDACPRFHVLSQMVHDLECKAEIVCTSSRAIVALDGRPLAESSSTTYIFHGRDETASPPPGIAASMLKRELALVLDRYHCGLYEKRELLQLDKNCILILAALMPYVSEHSTKH